jgi:RimJ/RimL family protein N-acetyltransferase
VATYDLVFTRDPQEFLDLAGGWLAADPVLTTVVSTIAHRTCVERADGVVAPFASRHWWLAVRDGAGTVVGAGMRTAPFEPVPPYLLPMPDEAAVQLARAMAARGEDVLGVNGSLPAIRVFGDEVVRLRGGTVEVAMHTRLFELGALTPPVGVPGRLRTAQPVDLDLVLAWFNAFRRDADEQAGRAPGTPTGNGESADRDDIARRIAAGRVWLWDDLRGETVHLTAGSAPSFGVARVGPVYTPPEHRRRGYASAAVAEVSRRVSADGTRVCLFTDQANPTSNKVYEALGYRPVADLANLALRAGD